jgi:hypothetical protein
MQIARTAAYSLMRDATSKAATLNQPEDVGETPSHAGQRLQRVIRVEIAASA